MLKIYQGKLITGWHFRQFPFNLISECQNIIIHYGRETAKVKHFYPKNAEADFLYASRVLSILSIIHQFKFVSQVVGVWTHLMCASNLFRNFQSTME